MLTAIEVKVLTAAKSTVALVNIKTMVTRRLRRQLEACGLPSNHRAIHGRDMCQISMFDLDAFVDNPEAWGEGWYPPVEMAHVAEYIQKLAHVLRIGIAEDGEYIWQMMEPFHTLLPDFILILFGKLVAYLPQEIDQFLVPFLLKIRSGNASSDDIFLQKSVYINTQLIHPLIPASLIARGMIPNNTDIVKPNQQNRFCYVGTPVSNVGMSVFQFGRETGTDEIKCVFTDPGVSHPFTRLKSLPPEVYATGGVHGMAGALVAKTREDRRAATPHNVLATGAPKKTSSRRKQHSKGQLGVESASQGVESDAVDDDVLTLAEWEIRHKGFFFVSRNHRLYPSASFKAGSSREIVENYGREEFGRAMQNMEIRSSQLVHPLDSLDNCFSCDSIRTVAGGRFALVYFVSGPRDIEFKIVHSRPTFAHIAKCDDTCSTFAELKHSSNNIRIVTRPDSIIAMRGEFFYFDPATLVKVSLAPGEAKVNHECTAVEIFSVSFGGGQIFPMSAPFHETAYPSCLSLKADESQLAVLLPLQYRFASWLLGK